MKKIFAVLLSVMLIFSSVLISVSAESKEVLRFGDDGKFTVLQISDTQDDRALAYGLVEFIEKAIELTQPDLIVLTGDIVENSRLGDICSDDEKFKEGVTVDGDYEATLRNAKSAVAQIFAPLEESGIPYAVTLGNNDYSSGVTNEDWLEIFSSYPGCITVDQSNDSYGKIDSYFEVLSSNSNEVKFGIWMLDNGKDFTDEQLNWMKNLETGNVPSVVFEHIPTDDVGNLFEECTPFDEGAVADGISVYRLNGEIASGHAEGIILPGTETQQFAVWQEKNVKGAFFGHWHTSGFTGTYNSITLGITYGCQFAKSGPYGIRTVVLDENSGEISTELYTYSNGAFTVQTDAPYTEYEDGFQKTAAGLVNFVKFLFNSLMYLLKF